MFQIQVGLRARLGNIITKKGHISHSHPLTILVAILQLHVQIRSVAKEREIRPSLKFGQKGWK